jgi:hypothetical protein
VWANNYYNNDRYKVQYSIDDDIYSIVPYTYCSKLVWDAFAFGANVGLPKQMAGASYVVTPYSFAYSDDAYTLVLRTIYTRGYWSY